MSADVRDFDRVHGAVYVNPATTMVSRLLDRRPRLGLLGARLLVRRFLDLPANASLGAALREGRHFQSSYFSESKFLAEADRHGGFDAFTDDLLDKIVYHPQTRHPFRPPHNSLLGDEAADFVAENLAKGALSWAGGQGVGWVADTAGLTTPGATAQDIANLQESIAELQSSVDELSKQLEASTQAILAALIQTQYSLLASPALALATQVDGVESDLNYLVIGCPPLRADGAAPRVGAVPAAYCKSQKALVISEMSESAINHSYETLSNAYLLDTQAVSFKGMIHLFSLSTGQSVRFFRPADSTNIQNMFNYWNAIETQAANLKVELLHQEDAQDNPGGKQELLDFLGDTTANPPTQGLLQTTHDAELKLILQAVPVGTVINTKDHTMWLTSYPLSTNPDQCQQPPPTGGAWKSPQVDFVIIQGLPWYSPTLDQTKALIDGWTGSNPNDWLVQQSQALDPLSPVSLGFLNVVTVYDAGIRCTPAPTIWTRDLTGGTVNIGGTNYSVRYTLDMSNGQVSSGNSPQGADGYTFNWIFLVRELQGGEQYYWYQ
jgi:hypothetical protein